MKSGATNIYDEEDCGVRVQGLNCALKGWDSVSKKT